MAKRKTRRRRQRTITKLKNIALLLLAFSRPIQMAMAGRPIKEFIDEATVGFARHGGFRQDFAVRFYGPMVAALVVNEVAKVLLKKFPVRG